MSAPLTAQALRKTQGLFRVAAEHNGFADHARKLEAQSASDRAQIKALREALKKAESFIANGREIAESGNETECAAEFVGSYCERLLERLHAALALGKDSQP